MNARVELIGKRFGRWTVLSYATRRSYWHCQCDCGTKKIVASGSLRDGRSTSCGCRRIDWKRHDLSGQRFGRLVVLSKAGTRNFGSGNRSVFLCLCDCGQEKTVLGSSLVGGVTKSCGCLKPLLTHGEASSGKETTEYRSWCSMMSRCQNPNNDSWEDYGGRGIRVCVRWKSFSSFLADMGRKPTPAHTIDRKDVNGHYEPLNCRWATKTEQVKNRRPILVRKLANFTTAELEGELARRAAKTQRSPFPS